MDRETAEDIKAEFRRQVGILSEDLRGQIAAVAEGQHLHTDQAQRIVDRLDAQDRRLDVFRGEVHREFGETKAMLKRSHGELQQRITDLEQR